MISPVFSFLISIINLSAGANLIRCAIPAEIMVRLGVHVSVAGGLEKAVERAKEKGCDAFQIFTTNPRSWSSKPIVPKSIEGFQSTLSKAGLYPVVSHMPYLPNLASPKEDAYARSVRALADELKRCRSLGIPYLVTHLGSHLGKGEEYGRERIAAALRNAINLAGNDVTILLENSAATRNSMGSTFKDLALLIESLPDQRECLGLCLDTCHLFAAGYDLRSLKAVEATVKEFESNIDLDLLRLVHLNDCCGTLGSHLDRHEHIGLEHIGIEGFRAIIRHPDLACRPMIMETPVDARRDDRGNLDMARSLASEIG